MAQFKAAAQLDEGSAESQFRLGRCLLAAGDASGARHALIAARDLDTLRFRCDSRLNDLTRKAASGRAARTNSPGRRGRDFGGGGAGQVPGWDLFYEHVHLTFHGNWLLARALAEQIEKLLPQDASPAAWPSEADCARRLGRTDRDLGPAVADIISRVTDPPFLTQINHDELIRYLTKQAGASRGASLAAAVQSAQAAIKMAPNEPELYENLAALEKSAKHASAAEEAARRAIELLPSCGEDWSQLGLILVEEKNYQEAASAFRQAFDLNRQDVWALQNLAMSLEKLGRKSDAIREYRRALALTPRFGLAWIGLGQLLESMGQKKKPPTVTRKHCGTGFTFQRIWQRWPGFAWGGDGLKRHRPTIMTRLNWIPRTRLYLWKRVRRISCLEWNWENPAGPPWLPGNSKQPSSSCRKSLRRA